jgi:D-3-phosphoglycerate dehydrogenase
MMKVLVSDALSDKGLAILKEAEGIEVDVKTGLKEEELVAIIGGYDALVIRSATKVTAPIIKAGVRLKVIGRAGVGVDNVDVPEATKRGIVVMNTPTGNTITTAEHALALLFSLCRHIPQANAMLKGGKWEKKKFEGVEVWGKTLGVLGLGRIGGEVARRAKGMGMQVVAYDPFINAEKAAAIGAELVTLDDLYARADFITVHLPLTDESRHIINERTIAKMKDGVLIVNDARGGIIDENALLAALESGKVAGAALDVFEQEPPPSDYPLLRHERIIVTPHLGASTHEAQENVSIDVAEQVVDALTRNLIYNAVNFPSIDPSQVPRLQPYIELAKKMGAMAGQLASGRMQAVAITYSGEVAALQVEPITIGVIEGLLRPILEDDVNFVNASMMAKERGITVTEATSQQEGDFTSLVTVVLTTDKDSFRIAGTLLGKKEPRIVSINDFRVEAIPSGNILLFANEDRPGIIGKIGTLLGEHQVNIAGMQYGRKAYGGDAISLLNVDSPVPDAALREIAALPYIRLVKLLSV